MAVPYIGSKTFLTMRQRIPYSRETVREITRPFMPGMAFVVDGLKSEPATVRTRTVCYSDAAVGQAEYDYSLMPGYLYSIGDEFGNVRTGILVVDVRPIQAIMTLPGSSVPSSVYALLDCEWVLQDMWY